MLLRQAPCQLHKIRVHSRLTTGDVQQPGLAGAPEALNPLLGCADALDLGAQQLGVDKTVRAPEVARQEQHPVGFDVVVHSAILHDGAADVKTDRDTLHQTCLFVLRRHIATARHCQNVWRMEAFRLPVASEVVREALRRMDGQDRLRGAKREQSRGAVRPRE